MPKKKGTAVWIYIDDKKWLDAIKVHPRETHADVLHRLRGMLEEYNSEAMGRKLGITEEVQKKFLLPAKKGD